MNRKLAVGAAAITLLATTGCNELQIQSVNVYSTGVQVVAVEVGAGSTGWNFFHAIARCVTPYGGAYTRTGPDASTLTGIGNKGGGVYESWAWCSPGDVTTSGGYAGGYR